MVGQAVVAFFIGASLCNCLPHLASGLQGRSFPTPFAKPHGVGDSSPLVNVLWGFFNIIIFYLLVCRVGDFDLKNAADAAAFGLGMLALGLPSARHFGRVNGGNAPERS